MAGTTHNVPKMWAHFQNKVDLEDPASQLDQVYLGCIERAAQVNARLVMDIQKLFSKFIGTNTDFKNEKKNPAATYNVEEVSTLCLDCHQTTSPGNCVRNVRDLLPN